MIVKKKAPHGAWWGNYIRFCQCKSRRLYDFKKRCFLNLKNRKLVGDLGQLFVAVILQKNNGIRTTTDGLDCLRLTRNCLNGFALHSTTFGRTSPRNRSNMRTTAVDI